MSKERTQRFPPIIPRDVHFVEAVVRLVFEEPLYAAVESTVGLLPRIMSAVERLPFLESESKALKLLRSQIGLHIHIGIPLTRTFQPSMVDYGLLPASNISDGVDELRLIEGVVENLEMSRAGSARCCISLEELRPPEYPYGSVRSPVVRVITQLLEGNVQ